MTDTRFYPDYSELLRIEQAARYDRAAEMGRLAALAVGKLKTLARRSAAALSRSLDPATVARTGGGAEHSGSSVTLASIMEELVASLPDELRTRYSQELLTAARVAPAIDLGIETWEFIVRIAAGTIHGIAQGLRGSAWCLDVAARRLMPLP